MATSRVGCAGPQVGEQWRMVLHMCDSLWFTSSDASRRVSSSTALQHDLHYHTYPLRPRPRTEAQCWSILQQGQHSHSHPTCSCIVLPLSHTSEGGRCAHGKGSGDRGKSRILIQIQIQSHRTERVLSSSFPAVPATPTIPPTTHASKASLFTRSHATYVSSHIRMNCDVCIRMRRCMVRTP